MVRRIDSPSLDVLDGGRGMLEKAGGRERRGNGEDEEAEDTGREVEGRGAEKHPICVSCNVKFADFNLLNIHRKVKIGKINSYITKVTSILKTHSLLCPSPTCCSSFDNQKEYVEHMVQNDDHRVIDIKTQVLVVDVEGEGTSLAPCNDCLRVFKTADSRARHSCGGQRVWR